MRFKDRAEAGRQLAAEVERLALDDPVVLALPRGGVPVGFELVDACGGVLDVFVVRKVGAPSRPELGMGAVSEDGGTVRDPDTLAALGVTDEQFEAVAAAARDEVARRVRRYRGQRPLTVVRDRDVVLVDDGLATGVSAEAALRALRSMGPRRLVLAAPVCAGDTARRLRPLADELVCLHTPLHFGAVGVWFDDFDQISDDEVVSLLARASR